MASLTPFLLLLYKGGIEEIKKLYFLTLKKCQKSQELIIAHIVMEIPITLVQRVIQNVIV